MQIPIVFSNRWSETRARQGVWLGAYLLYLMDGESSGSSPACHGRGEVGDWAGGEPACTTAADAARSPPCSSAPTSAGNAGAHQICDTAATHWKTAVNMLFT